MSNEPTKSAEKKSYKWLVLPFAALIVLTAIKFTTDFFAEKKKKAEEQAIIPAQSLKSPSDSYEPPRSVYRPSDVMIMVEKNEDYIAGVLKKSMNHYYSSGDSVFTYKRFINGNLEEIITTFRDYPNRLIYTIVNELAYHNFVEQIQSLSPTQLPQKEYDRYYSDSVHLLVNDCVFIPIGFKKALDGYCVAVIQKNHIISNNKIANRSADTGTGEIFTTIYRKTDVYNSPNNNDKSGVVLEYETHVTYIETVGKYAKCMCRSKNGVPIEGYILVKELMSLEKRKKDRALYLRDEDVF